jgi:hypothetical protein
MVISKLKKLREKVLKELEHIPDWPKPQKDLRMSYWFFRMHSLGKKAKTKKSAKEVLEDCIADLKKKGGVYHKKGNDYEFLYDKEFFKKEEN